MTRVGGHKPGVLLVANWDSGVGYAWWLMESYWCVIAAHYAGCHVVQLAYPSISALPGAIAEAPLTPLVMDCRVRRFRDLVRMLRFLYANRIRVVYLTDRAAVHPLYALFRCVGVRAIVVHDHTPGIRTEPMGVKRLFKWLIARMPWAAADAMIGATQFVRRRHLEVGCVPPDRCFCVPNGLPNRPAPLPMDIHAHFGIPRERRVIVTVSRAHRYKGIEFALSVIRELAHASPNGGVHYLFCGDGPDLDFFRHISERDGLAGRVTFAGKRDDIRALLRGCDIALHPSRGEVGYSLSILEYMEAGLPVVVPDNPSVCEATADGETGFVYREGDIASAITALRTLLAEPQRRRAMGALAAERQAQQYSLEDSHEKLIAIIDRVYGYSLSSAPGAGA